MPDIAAARCVSRHIVICVEAIFQVLLDIALLAVKNGFLSLSLTRFTSEVFGIFSVELQQDL